MKHYFNLFLSLDGKNPLSELELYINFEHPEYDEVELGTVCYDTTGDELNIDLTDKMLEKITEDIWKEINHGEYE